MFTLTSRKPFRATALAIAAASTLLAASVGPAMAECRYGSPHCVNPHYNPAVIHATSAPTIDGTGNGWEDPDCAYYGNCLSANHDDGCWYVNGTCRPNPQTPGSTQPNLRLPSRTLATLQTTK